MVDQRLLSADHICDGDDGEGKIVRFARIGIDGKGTRCPGATPQNIGTDDEIFIGIDAFAGADHGVPPAGFGVIRGVFAADVGISCQGMIDQDRIGTVGIESACGFEPYIDLFEFSAAIKFKGCLQTEILRNGQKCSLLFDFLPPFV